MDKENIARPWQPPNMPDQVAELIENDQLLQDMNIRGLASADCEEVRVALGNLQSLLLTKHVEGYAKGYGAGFREAIIRGAIVVGSVGGAILIFAIALRISG